MAAIICGFPRSGTTLLRNLCQAHPDIEMTMEFNSFGALGSTRVAYTRFMLRHLWINHKRTFLVQGEREEQRRLVLRSYKFTARFLYEINRQKFDRVTPQIVANAMRRIYPKAQVVGDKFPYYLFQLDKLATYDDLLRIAIFRDGRDVVSSYLRKVRGDWRGMKFVENKQDAGAIAASWTEGIEMMDRYRERLYLIRYEALADDPGQVLGELAGKLGVDPAGFPIHMVHPRSLGKHQTGLTRSELDDVYSLTNNTLRRLGYI